MVAGALLIPTLAACGGGSSKPKLAAKSSTSTTSISDSSSTTVPGAAAGPGVTQPGGSAAQPGAAAGGKGSATTTPNTPITPAPPGPQQTATGTIDRPCVHRGASEPQGITVHMTSNSTVGYDTVYSDNSTEMSNKTYKTGYGYGKSDGNGTYHTTWVVPPTAPLGKATVYVLTSADKPPLPLPFNIVAATEKCP